MKICAFGNSFMITIMEAIQKSALNGSVTFAGIYAGKFALSIEDGVVKLGDGFHLNFADGTGPELRLSDYDAFLIIGLRLGFNWAAPVYSHHRLWQHAGEDHYIISEGALHASIKDQLTQTINIDLARQLREHTDKPIFIIAEPNPIEEIKTIPLTTDRLKKAYDRFEVCFQDDIGLELYRAFVRAAQAVAGDLSATFIPQPADTLTPVFSDNRYKVDHKPKFAPEPGVTRAPMEGDIFHLNQEFGQLVVKQITPILTEAAGAKSAVPA